ncbi:MAG: elongation factor G [Phycisphaera sp.]|nr:elongation factor G [Phycisphaera sp.]
MPSYTTQDIRNIAIVGHAAAGKTTLVEAILHAGGAINAPGSVEKGTTVCDFEPEEKHHGHSLNNAVAHLDHNGKHINLIDTPGYPDFMGPALASLPAVETVAVVVNAHNGVEMMTRRMMQRAKERNLCRLIIINKIDTPADDATGQPLEHLVAQLRGMFGKECRPINLPAGGGAKVVDVFDHASGEADFSSVADAHGAIVDQVVEVDEELMAKYLEQGEVKPEQLHAPFEKALREGHLVPICFVSAKTGAGVDELLHLFTDLMPNPTEGNPRPFVNETKTGPVEVHPEPDPSKHVLAHVFKVVDDRFGKLGIFRIHQGTVRKESQLFVGHASKPFKVGHLFKVQGKDHPEVDAGIPGDLCGVIKVEEVHFDAVLHDSHDEDDIHLLALNFPSPMAGLAIVAKARGDEQKIMTGLARLAQEDPCFVVERNSVTHELVIRGMGELHLRVMLEKLKNKYGVEVDTHPPKIAYKETITSKAEGHHRHKKQTGGAGQFGEVYLRVEPLERGKGFEFVDDTVGGSIPNQFIPAIEKGIRQVLDLGAVAGYPFQDVRVSVYDGKHHPVDSKEVAFVTAGKRAFIDAIKSARPVVLEPIVMAEVTVPNAHMGDITSDLSGKRGRIQGTDMLPGDMAVIKALVPLSEIANYQSQLKSVTAGQGSYTMELSHYDPVPSHIQQQIVAQYKPQHEED